MRATCSSLRAPHAACGAGQDVAAAGGRVAGGASTRARRHEDPSFEAWPGGPRSCLSQAQGGCLCARLASLLLGRCMTLAAVCSMCLCVCVCVCCCARVCLCLCVRAYLSVGRQARNETRAATHMQRVTRGRAARRRVSKIKAEKQLREQTAAATRIASAARGKQARKRVGALREERRQLLEAQASDAPRRRRRPRKRGSSGAGSNTSGGAEGGDGVGAGRGDGGGASSAPATEDGRPPRP